MKSHQKNRICRKGATAAVVLTAVVLNISGSLQNKGVVSAFTTSQCRASAKTKLFEVNGEKMAIELLTDQNREALLHPDVDPSRPVLVDAFA
jgi:hypothetical protein